MRKFTMSIIQPEELDGEMGYHLITNRAGRKWRSKTPTEVYYLSEEQDALEPYLNDGGKLDASRWVEI